MRTYLEMAVPRTRRIGFAAFEANLHNHIALAGWLLGSVADVRDALRSSLSAHPDRRTRYPRLVPPDTVLVACDLRDGDLSAAIARLRQELALTRSLPAAPPLLGCIDGHSWLAVSRERPDVGARLLGFVAATRSGGGPLMENEGDPLGVIVTREHERNVAMAKDAMEASAFDAEWGAGWAMGVEDALADIDDHLVRSRE